MMDSEGNASITDTDIRVRDSSEESHRTAQLPVLSDN